MLIPDLTPHLEDIVKQVAEAEPPPQAHNMKEVKENCQGWSFRVIEQLKARNMIRRDVHFLKGLQQRVK